jgi:hypothetical protein
MWELLAAHTGPAIAGILKTLLLDDERLVDSSVLHERLGRELEALRADGEDLPRNAQDYLNDWVRSGWLTRRLPDGAAEEVFELTTAAADVIRFLDGAIAPRNAATESRLATVITQLVRLSEETDTNPETRISALVAERERINRDIERVRAGVLTALPDPRAVERAREIIELAQALAEDFRRVKDEFGRLNRGLRESLMDNAGSRGDVLEALFAGVDVIAETDAGRTWSAFWSLLTDREQLALLSDSLQEVTSRPFARRLETRERRFLLSMTSRLVDEGSEVHDVVQNLGRSLKTFVQSREFREQRRLYQLLKDANQLALLTREKVRPNQVVGYEFALSSSRIRSISQWVLYDPSQRIVDDEMSASEDAELSLEDVGELLKNSEIDFRVLRQNVHAILQTNAQVSIGQVLTAYPAAQGLGTVVGYVALGSKHGLVTGTSEVVEWTGQDEVRRRARLPAIYFLKEAQHEFAD